jgi:hypothetical protein
MKTTMIVDDRGGIYMTPYARLRVIWICIIANYSRGRYAKKRQWCLMANKINVSMSSWWVDASQLNHDLIHTFALNPIGGDLSWRWKMETVSTKGKRTQSDWHEWNVKGRCSFRNVVDVYVCLSRTSACCPFLDAKPFQVSNPPIGFWILLLSRPTLVGNDWLWKQEYNKIENKTRTKWEESCCLET